MIFRAILFWAFIGALAVASWYGPYVLKKDRSPAGIVRYRRYTYGFAFCFGLIPAFSGDWAWCILTIPLAELVAHFWILERPAPE